MSPVDNKLVCLKFQLDHQVQSQESNSTRATSRKRRKCQNHRFWHSRGFTLVHILHDNMTGEETKSWTAGLQAATRGQPRCFRYFFGKPLFEPFGWIQEIKKLKLVSTFSHNHLRFASNKGSFTSEAVMNPVATFNSWLFDHELVLWKRLFLAAVLWAARWAISMMKHMPPAGKTNLTWSMSFSLANVLLANMKWEEFMN